MAPALARAGPVGGAVALRGQQASVGVPVPRWQDLKGAVCLPRDGRRPHCPPLADCGALHWPRNHRIIMLGRWAAFDATRLSPTRAPFEN